MIEIDIPVQNSIDSKPSFSGDFIPISLLSQRCSEVLESDFPGKKDILMAYARTVQSMLLTPESTTYIANLAFRISAAESHLQTHAVEGLVTEIRNFLRYDPKAQDAYGDAVTLLTQNIKSEHLGQFYEALGMDAPISEVGLNPETVYTTAPEEVQPERLKAIKSIGSKAVATILRFLPVRS